MKKRIIRPLFVAALVVFGTFAATGQRPVPPDRLPPFMGDPRGRDIKQISFNVDRYYYVYARGANPNQTTRLVRLIGRQGNFETYAYLSFNDNEADKPPFYDESNYTLYMYYPEAYFPEIQNILESPGRVVCQIFIMEKDSIWASVESPVIDRATITRRP